MEFMHRNIYMEKKKWEINNQITVDEDINIPENKGDCAEILLKNAAVRVREVRTGREQVTVKGALEYQILYAMGDRLEQLTGNIPIEEVMNVSGTTPGEVAFAKGKVEDFKVTMINTRKLSVQAVITLYSTVNQMVEESWVNDALLAGENLEKKYVEREITQLCQKKTDVLRIKEEVEIPMGYPAIAKILWETVEVGELETRPMDGKISIKGELNTFFAYLPQGVHPTIKFVTKKVPFHGLVECSGCKMERMISSLITLNQYNVEVKQDVDGEYRILFLEATLDILLRVFSEERVALLKDMYSVNKELEPIYKEVYAPVLYAAGDGKLKLKQTRRLQDGAPRMVQMIHTKGNTFPEEERWEENILYMTGAVQCQILYMTGEEDEPYAEAEWMIPYEFQMEGGNRTPKEKEEMEENPIICVETWIEQIEAVQLDSEEVEIRAIIACSVLVEGNKAERCICDADVKPLDKKVYTQMPSMVVCFADSKSSLWDYGKKYRTPVEEIKRLNNLQEQEVREGEKIMLVKGMESKK